MKSKGFDKWISLKTKEPLVITGCYGSGKTYYINDLSKNKYIIKFINISISPVVPIEHLLLNKPYIFVLDNCEEYDKESSLQDFYNSIKDKHPNIIFICEINNLNRFSFLNMFQIIKINKLPYYKFKSLTKSPFNSKTYYDKYYNGDLRQYLSQSKMGIIFKTDEFLEKKELMLKLVNKEKPKISEFKIIHSIICESYLKSQYYKQISEVLLNTLKIYNSNEINSWINIYYPMYYFNNTMIDFEYKNISWTKVSNLKYKKKSIQNIRRQIDIQHVGYDNVYKILELRNELLQLIEFKKLKEVKLKLNYYNIPYIYLNYFPKLQINDKYTTYVSRLKSFYSYVNNSK